MKTLNTIQTLSKIGKVLSKIVYICCIVGFCGCAVGIIAMLGGEKVLKIGGMTLHGILETEAGVSTGTVFSAIAVGIIFSVGEFFISRMAYSYFENELNAGTPFTLSGAKELLHLGISIIWIPIASIVAAEIAQGIIAEFSENTQTLTLDGFDGVALGVMFILMSLLCKYGAELHSKETVNENEQ